MSVVRTSSFSNSLAHHDETLESHLLKVTNEAYENIKGTKERIEQAVILLTLFHDAGKSTRWFQEKIKGEFSGDERSNHSRLGALLANHFISHIDDISDDERVWLRYTVVAGIAKHHTNINENPRTTLKKMKQEVRDGGDIYREQLDSIDFEGFSKWFEERLKEYGFSQFPKYSIGEIFDSLMNVSTISDKPFKHESDGIDFLISWGTLLGADKIRSAHPDWEFSHTNVPDDIVESFKRKKFTSVKTNLDKIRDSVFNDIKETLKKDRDRKFYTITAPTGSGKTLTGLSTALSIKKYKETKYGFRSRIIYCLPFTSIIEQNSEVYQEVLESSGIETGSNVLLRHHHLADSSYSIRDEYVDDGADILVETWESEIIVTTFYQLLYTLFTSKNRMAKRISALKNAVVVMDEVQAIPHRYWEAIYKMFSYISSTLNTTFVLMTATMPMIFPTEVTTELLPSYPKYYEELSRTEILNQTSEDIYLQELVEILKEYIGKKPRDSRIIILNRRSVVRELYSQLEKEVDNLWMLSTDLTPKDRYKILFSLNDPYTLVTTQVVEAGVDISAQEVWRDVAPLDSIIQSAGRCNRYHEIDKGVVRLIRMLDNQGKTMAVPPYDGFLIATTQEILSRHDKIIKESNFKDLAREYYELLKERSEQADIMKYFRSGDLHKLEGEDGFQLIRDIPRQSYFIIQDEKDKYIWEKYESLKEVHDPINKKRMFQSIKREFMERIVNQAHPSPSHDIVPIYPESERYDPKTGLKPISNDYEVI